MILEMPNSNYLILWHVNMLSSHSSLNIGSNWPTFYPDASYLRRGYQGVPCSVLVYDLSKCLGLFKSWFLNSWICTKKCYEFKHSVYGATTSNNRLPSGSFLFRYWTSNTKACNEFAGASPPDWIALYTELCSFTTNFYKQRQFACLSQRNIVYKSANFTLSPILPARERRNLTLSR